MKLKVKRVSHEEYYEQMQELPQHAIRMVKVPSTTTHHFWDGVVFGKQVLVLYTDEMTLGGKPLKDQVGEPVKSVEVENFEEESE